MRLPLLLLLIAVSPLVLAHDDSRADTNAHAAIEAANRNFEATFARTDPDGMASLYSREGQVLPTGSDAIAGHQAIAAYWRAAFEAGIERVELETLELDTHGDRATEVGRYTLHGAGEQVIDRGKYVVIWTLENGEWKLHRDIFNTNTPAPAAPTDAAMRRCSPAATWSGRR
ncbi:MAG: nuclear transport factor 2 family protein [Proteobacteria bacterium]|nr:nuclear transport factor 2 family protein [Pseudomonadota bacterium]